jgi:hypothetical protein
VLLEFSMQDKTLQPAVEHQFAGTQAWKSADQVIKLPDGPTPAEGLCLIVTPGFGVRDGDQPHIVRP